MSPAISDTPDAREELRDTATKLRHATLEVLWRQWAAVGGTASVKLKARAIVDPEALVLMSLTLQAQEHRLTDFVADWAAHHSDLLSVQRTRNLARAYPPQTTKQMQEFARVAVRDGKDARWRPLAGDQHAVAHGPLNSRRASKKRGRRPTFIEPTALLLRLRLGLGVGAKADILACLLGIEGNAWVSVRLLSTATGYTIAAVRRAAEELAAARFINAMADGPTVYSVSTTGWEKALEMEPPLPRWRAWHQRFAFVAAFLAWSERATQRPLSPYVLGVRGREIMENHRDALRWERVVVWDDHAPISDWAHFVLNSAQTLARWLGANA